LFQALVAAASSGGTLPGEDRDALSWLEHLDPPFIAAPAVRAGNGFRNYVPNNDLDAVGGDPRRVAEIRTAKFIKPLFFDSHIPVLYAWQFEKGEERARRLCAISERLYQLGRGVDMAWAWGEIVEAVELDDRLAQHGGPVYRPSNRGRGPQLLCPQPGSLCSLDRRFEAMGKRISKIKSGDNGQQLFSQPPRPSFTLVAYDGTPQRFFFEIRESVANSAFAPWPLTAVSALVENLRDRAAQRLKGALPKQAATIDRVFVGREATDADKAARIRIGRYSVGIFQPFRFQSSRSRNRRDYQRNKSRACGRFPNA
jgi:CRISPR-associated protein Csb2